MNWIIIRAFACWVSMWINTGMDWNSIIILNIITIIVVIYLLSDPTTKYAVNVPGLSLISKAYHVILMENTFQIRLI
jgi:hypothetical protein